MRFYNSGSSGAIAILKGGEIDQFSVYAKGYFHVATCLAESLAQRERFPDYDGYPLIFLYRQSLELYLKHTIYQAARIVSYKNLKPLSDELLNKHELASFATRGAEVLKELFPSDASLHAFYDRVVTVSREFEEIDQNSFVYRYPVTTKGGPVTNATQTVTLDSFCATMGEILSGFDTLDFGLDVELQLEQEDKAHILELLASITRS